jgi:NAD(P)H-dependent glutamate synthase small subunit
VPDPRGFLLYDRENPPKRPVAERVRDYAEVEQRLPPKRLEVQAARCMDCGIPFCHTYGCPVGNLIPDWNDMVARGQWRRALELLERTNTLPEITGRVCPAPCEAACTLAINQPAVTIKHIELQIIERGWERGWVEPSAARVTSGKRVAVVGSGPTGLAAARRLARRGHEVVVFERADRLGGILRYGIPDFKLEKSIIDRRIEQMEAEGIAFERGVEVGEDLSVRYMRRSFDALLIAAGARVPRDLDVPGRELDGVHFAMTYLTQQNRINGGEDVPSDERISAAGRSVVVIGGGDTGADCVGTARRQGARTIRQIELLPEPPPERPEDNPWPEWPKTLRASSSHEEGCERLWSVLTKEFVGVDGRVTKLQCVKLDWSAQPGGRPSFTEIAGSEFELEADLVLFALGFLRVEHGALTEGFDLKTDARGNLEVGPDQMTSTPGVFAGGDAVLGASLVVRAIDLGQRAAESMDRYLEASSLS